MSTQKQTHVLTGNQLVAQNLRLARELRGLTQEQAAERLEPFLGARWSKATFSAAERSAVEGTRAREFSADELLAFANAFDLPLFWFFLPVDLEARVSSGGERTLDSHDLFGRTLPYYHDFAAAEPRLTKLVEQLPNKMDEQIRLSALTRARYALVAAVGPLGSFASDLEQVAAAMREIEQKTPAALGEERVRSPLTRALAREEPKPKARRKRAGKETRQ
jgi:transcriptional regulator with XRE-family HTH domain